LVAITVGFRVLYVFVVMEVGSRRILHCNLTAHPTAVTLRPTRWTNTKPARRNGHVRVLKP
jgi:hypothetical protein